MAVRNLWLFGGGLAACFVLCGDGYPQQPIPAPVPSLPAPVAASDLTPPAPVVPITGQTVDQLLDRLTDLRRQKAELERQEQLVVKQLRDKLKAQTDRLEKLGIASEPKAELPVPELPPGTPMPELPGTPTPDLKRTR